MGLSQVLGCWESAVQSVPGSKTELILNSGARVPGRLYEETLGPMLRSSARVIAHWADGRPAAIESNYGKGKTIALGTYISTAYQAQPTDAARDFFRGLLPWAGVQPELLVEGDVEMRWLESGHDRMVFVFNHGDKPEKARVVLPGAWDLRDLGGSAIEDVNILVPPNGVWIAVAKRAGR